LAQALAVLYGIKPVIIAVVVQALWGLGKAAVKTGFLGFVAVGALAASLLGVNELAVLFAGGIAVAFWRWAMERRHAGVSAFMPLLGTAAATAPAAAGVTFGLWPLFLVFLKIGSVLFGGLCPAGISPGGPRRTARMADRGPTSRCGRGRADDSWPAVHHGDVHAATSSAGGMGRWLRLSDLPSGVFLRRPERPVWSRESGGSPTAGAVLDGVNVAFARAHGRG